MTVFHNKRPRLSLSSVQKATGELVVEVLHCQKSLQGLRRVGLVLNYVRTVVSAAFPPPVQTTPARHVGCLLAALDIALKTCQFMAAQRRAALANFPEWTVCGQRL